MDTQAAVLESHADESELSETDAVTVESINVRDPTGEEVLVEVTAASLCHTDVKMTRGNIDNPLPLVMGHEGTGIVRAVGEEVRSVTPGDSVVFGRIACGKCEFCVAGRSNLCTRRSACRLDGTLRTGAQGFSRNKETIHHCHGVSSFSEYTLVTDDVAIPVPEDLPAEQATLLGCGVFTGVGAVMNTARVDPGSSVALFGTGGVGLSGLQGAVLSNATTIIAVDIDDDKLELANNLGATHTVNSNDEDPVEAIREWTDGGVDYAFDMVGNPTVTQQSIDVLRPTGTAVIVGTPGTGRFSIDIELQNFLATEKRVLGSFNGSYNLRHAIPTLAEITVAGKLSLDPLITDTKPLGAVHDALAALESGEALRQVLIP